MLAAVMRERDAAVAAEKAKDYVGKMFRALVVAPGVARLESQAPDVDGVVRFKGGAEIGAFADMRIEKVDGFDFLATALPPNSPTT